MSTSNDIVNDMFSIFCIVFDMGAMSSDIANYMASDAIGMS